MATFTWTPDYRARAKRKPNNKGIKFGDGYEQRYGNGINTIKQIWPLTFSNRSETEGLAIDAFLTARSGVESFDWTPPDGVAGKYKCEEWDYEISVGTLKTITATFEQVFEA